MIKKPRTFLLMILCGAMSAFNLYRLLNAGADSHLAFISMLNFIGIWVIFGIALYMDNR